MNNKLNIINRLITLTTNNKITWIKSYRHHYTIFNVEIKDYSYELIIINNFITPEYLLNIKNKYTSELLDIETTDNTIKTLSDLCSIIEEKTNTRKDFLIENIIDSLS